MKSKAYVDILHSIGLALGIVPQP